MVNPQLLSILRCALDTSSPLEDTPEGLVCKRCGLIYSVREGIPCMLPEEATLPPGCKSLDDLPCKRKPPGADS